MKNPKTLLTSLLGATLALSIPLAQANPTPVQDKGKGKGKGKQKTEAPGKQKGGKPGKGPKSKGDPKSGKGPEKGPKKAHVKGKGKVSDDIVKYRFADPERDLIRRVIGVDQVSSLPPGLAKNLRRGKALPPGWQDKVVGGSIVGDEIWDYFVPVSSEFFPGLTNYDGVRLYRYGNELVRVFEPRREVIDTYAITSLLSLLTR